MPARETSSDSPLPMRMFLQMRVRSMQIFAISMTGVAGPQFRGILMAVYQYELGRR